MDYEDEKILLPLKDSAFVRDNKAFNGLSGWVNRPGDTNAQPQPIKSAHIVKTRRTTYRTVSWNHIIQAKNGMFIMCGSQLSIATSTTGLGDWTFQTILSGMSGTLSRVIQTQNGMFMTIGFCSSAEFNGIRGIIATSPTGLGDWTVQNMNTIALEQGISLVEDTVRDIMESQNGMIIICGNKYVATSPTGLGNWTFQNYTGIPLTVTNMPRDIIWERIIQAKNGLFVAVGDYFIATSPTGLGDWTFSLFYKSNLSNIFQSSNGMFIVVRGDDTWINSVYTSTSENPIGTVNSLTGKMDSDSDWNRHYVVGSPNNISLMNITQGQDGMFLITGNNSGIATSYTATRQQDWIVQRVFVDPSSSSSWRRPIQSQNGMYFMIGNGRYVATSLTGLGGWTFQDVIYKTVTYS